MRFQLLALILLLYGVTQAEPGHLTDSFEASVVGEVKCQGRHQFKTGSTLKDLWLSSGGPTAKADLKAASLVHDGREVTIDLSPDNIDALNRTKLAAGDVLLVFRGLRVGVAGEVHEKGVFAISKRSTTPLQDAIEAAGGAKGSAALTRVQIARPTLRKAIVVDLSQPLKNIPNLEDGDTIVVPPRRCIIIGAVEKQGQQLLNGNETLLDVISESGFSRGRLDQVAVIRAADVEAGTDKKEIYDIQAALERKSVLPDVHIFDGDVIFVPPIDGSPFQILEWMRYRGRVLVF